MREQAAVGLEVHFQHHRGVAEIFKESQKIWTNIQKYPCQSEQREDGVLTAVNKGLTVQTAMNTKALVATSAMLSTPKQALLSRIQKLLPNTAKTSIK